MWSTANSVKLKYYVLLWDSDLEKYADVYGPMPLKDAIDTQRNLEFIAGKSVVVQEVVNEEGKQIV